MQRIRETIETVTGRSESLVSSLNTGIISEVKDSSTLAGNGGNGIPPLSVTFVNYCKLAASPIPTCILEVLLVADNQAKQARLSNSS